MFLLSMGIHPVGPCCHTCTAFYHHFIGRYFVNLTYLVADDNLFKETQHLLLSTEHCSWPHATLRASSNCPMPPLAWPSGGRLVTAGSAHLSTPRLPSTMRLPSTLRLPSTGSDQKCQIAKNLIGSGGPAACPVFEHVSRTRIVQHKLLNFDVQRNPPNETCQPSI